MPIKEGCSEACSKLRCSSGVWAGAAFTAIFVGSIALMVVVTYNHKKSLDRNYEWWQRTVIYHIFTPSFFDENNDGFGDLKGISSKLDYIADLGVDSVFLSAFYQFGQVDMGYDVIDHKRVDPIFGSNEDLEQLLSQLDAKDLTGDEVHQDVQEYIATIPQEEVERRANALLCWEMDNHDKVVERGKETSRIPFYQNELVMMTTLLLPGTVIMYYGDEIGMSDSTEIKCQQSQDPFATPPYGVECKDYPEFSRDPGRAPMQWNNSTFAGFTEAKSGPWLPVSSQYPEVNVEWEQSQANSKLSFFKELMKIREEDPIYHGEVFYPYHDRNIFSFLRLVEETNIGLLVVANIHQLNDIKVDIHSVLPGVPDVGVIRAATSKHNEFPNFIVGEDIHLNQIVMASFEGLVIEIDFAPKEEHSL